MHAGPAHHVPGLPAPGRCLVMGVLNVTPDSFSDGGLFLDPDAAVAHGLELVAQGADLVDVGGESTRPGALRVTVEEELERVVPVVGRLAAAGARVSVDTMRAPVAQAAVEAGAVLVNDVSGGRADEDMFATVARLRTPYVLMHWRAHSAEMEQHTRYVDVVGDVMSELSQRLEVATGAGVDADLVVLDPGIGFAKTGEQNWEVLAGLERLHALGRPLLVGTSRKRFLGTVLADTGEEPRSPERRDHATAATTALAAAAGAWCVRVHDVPSNRDAVLVAARWGREAR